MHYVQQRTERCGERQRYSPAAKCTKTILLKEYGTAVYLRVENSTDDTRTLALLVQALHLRVLPEAMYAVLC